MNARTSGHGARAAGIDSKGTRVALALIILISTSCSIWFASAMPNGRRFWDESHSLRNIRTILQSGSLRPSYPFYPALSHLPQTGLLYLSQGIHRTTGNASFEVLKPNGHFTPTAYFITRATSIAYSIAVLVVVFFVGRRHFSEEVGLLATGILVISPAFLKTAGTYKPDALLVLTALAAFHFAVRAAERERLSSYLFAGGAVGLSAACKQNGALSSIPLIAATAINFRSLRSWIRLAIAGAVSVGVFLAFNPWPSLLDNYLSMGQRYVNWSQGQPAPASNILIFALRLPLSGNWHGPLVGSIAWAGLLGLGRQAIKSRTLWPQQAASALFVLFVSAYPVACFLVSRHPKLNIFIPLLPFTALAAAWALVRLRDLAVRHLSRRAGRLATALGLVLIITAAAPSYGAYIYNGTVLQTTTSAAADWIAKDAGFLAHRIFVSEGVSLRVGAKRLRSRAYVPMERVSERLRDLPSATLNLSDYEVFPSSALTGEESDFYKERMDRVDQGRTLILESRLFKRKGEPLVVVAHPWRIYGARNAGTVPPLARLAWKRPGPRRLAANLPARFRPGQVLSLDVALTPLQASDCEISFDSEPVMLHRYHRSKGRSLFMGLRFVLETRAAPIRFTCASREALATEPEVGVMRWIPRRAVSTAG